MTDGCVLGRPILRVPTLAIHLDRSVNTDGFKFNMQTHVLPVLSTALKNQLETAAGASHHALLMKLLSEELGCEGMNSFRYLFLLLVSTMCECILCDVFSANRWHGSVGNSRL